MKENHIFENVNGTKIYPINYLINEELSDLDLENLLNNKNKGFLCSIIIAMHKEIGCTMSSKDIIKSIFKDNTWQSKNKWTYKQRLSFEQKLTKAIKNIWNYSEYVSKQKAQWYLLIYGLDVKNNKFKLN